MDGIVPIDCVGRFKEACVQSKVSDFGIRRDATEIRVDVALNFELVPVV
jgi:hypothetical protein